MIFTDLATDVYRVQLAKKDAQIAGCLDLGQASVV